MLAAGYDLWKFVSEYHVELLHGLFNTLKVSALAIAGSYVIGIVLGAARAHRIPVVSQLAAVYVELIRNTPILAQIFLLCHTPRCLPWTVPRSTMNTIIRGCR